MGIKILQLLEGARQARGLTVIIDVFRAFSTACYAAGQGLGPIYPVGTLEEAFLLKKRLEDALLMGERNERRPSLVCMGYACQHPTDEDTLCAEYIRSELTVQSNDFEAMREKIRKGSGARFFEESSQEWAPEADFELCLALDRFGFILKAEKGEHGLFLRKIEKPALPGTPGSRDKNIV